jgi:hypothetical protein
MNRTGAGRGGDGEAAADDQRWTALLQALLAETASELGPPAAGDDLMAAVERHLLMTQLTDEQRLSVAARGWFALPWPEQRLILHVHTARVPTVDGYQARPVPRDLAVATGLVSGAPEGSTVWLANTYHLSWDVRFTERSTAAGVTVPRSATTPVGAARRVLVAHRRGLLRPLLEAAAIVRLGGDLGDPGRGQLPPGRRWR